MNPASNYPQNASYQEQSWSKVYEALKARDRALQPEEVYQLAHAAYLIGKDEESIDYFTRTHHQFLENKNIKRAIRCAFWLGMLLMYKGEQARGSGWFSRAHRLIEEHQYEGPEIGLLLVPAGLGSLGTGNAQKAYTNFKKAHEIGKEYHDLELTILSMLGLGQSMIQLGHIPEGISLLDESMVTIESTNISPLVIGIVYCAVTETCQMIFDIRRAQEWTTLLSQWCDSQPEIIPFRGQCLIRRSQIMHIHGDWSEALDEMQRASQILSKPPGEPAAGEAYYLLADIFRLKGNLEKAENLYVEANKWGRKPQPGLALLRLAQEKKDMAIKSIQNALDESKTPIKRVKILPAYIEIMLAHDKIVEARIAVEELVSVALKYDTIFLQAISTSCQGALFIKEDDQDTAIKMLCKSLNFWNELNAPYEAAVVRLHLGMTYKYQGDHDTATVELTAARWIFKELDAIPNLKKVEALLKTNNEQDLHGLTLREFQVLQLVSEGQTNKIIAGKLFISERTVERHLSNIFNKLQVNSRTEATTFAYKHQML